MTLNEVAQTLIKTIEQKEQTAIADTHYYRGAKDGVAFLVQEFERANSVPLPPLTMKPEPNAKKNEHRSGSEGVVSAIRQKPKKR